MALAGTGAGSVMIPPMDFAKWVAEFKVLHQKAHKGELKPAELEKYLADRNELAAAVLANQRIAVRAGQQPRSVLKATRVLPIEIEVNCRMRPLMTLELSAEGFTALTGDAPAPDKPAAFVLKLPGSEPISGEALCVQATKQTGNFKCQFKYEASVGPNAREKIELFVFGDLLTHLKS